MVPSRKARRTANREPNALPRPDREYPVRPIVGVGAVVVRNVDALGGAKPEVLLVRRGAEPSYGQWSIPGGAVELGETIREAAAREVREECGITVDVDGIVEVVDRVVRDTKGDVQYHYVLIDFAARYRTGELRADSDALDARWTALDELDRVDLSPVTLAVIRKAFAQLSGGRHYGSASSSGPYHQGDTAQ